MKRKSQGFTFLETIVVLGILSLFIYGFTKYMSMPSKTVATIEDNLDRIRDAGLMEHYLSNIALSTTMRFFHFDSKGNPVRALRPLPEMCANLSFDSECQQDTAILYTKYRSSSPSLSIICRIAPIPGVDDKAYYVIDLSNSRYGNGVMQAGGLSVEVTHALGASFIPEGKVFTNSNSILALLTTPNAYLFNIKNVPIQFHPTQDATSETFSGNPEFTFDCYNRLQVQSIDALGQRRFNVSNLYKVELVPLFISELAPDNPPITIDFSAEILNPTDYPIRAFNVELEVFGKSKIGDKMLLGISKCSFQNGTFQCTPHADNNLMIHNAVSLRIDQSFKIPLFDASGNMENDNNWYEIISNTQTATCASLTPECITGALVSTSKMEIAHLANIAETDNHLLSNNFSMIKQRELAGLRFRYKQQQKQQMGHINLKDGEMYVFLP
ncbi:MAG: prepilin-type N-terminal cleavage/methylation domain-containing protein [Oligoflexia bacterium]|nr:prepilin-type N-terminal cleavage/methylation domain-containing protein [Oligoflexia bacterium]